MKTLLWTIALTGWSCCCWAQPPDSLWSRMYGGTGMDLCNAVKQTGDGGFILAGRTNFSSNDVDAWLVKTDANGNSQWTRMLGGSMTEVAWDVVTRSQGGYAMVGETHSFGAGNDDVYFATYSAEGVPQNISYWGGSMNDNGYSLEQTSDGGFVIGGMTNSFGGGASDMWLVKCDAAGALQWAQDYGGSGYDICYAITQTPDGGYALAGYTSSYGAGSVDAWLVRTNSNGQVLWSRTYGYAGEDVAYDMIKTSDGGFALAGYTQNDGDGERDMYVVKTDGNGTVQWIQSFGGQYDDICYSIRQTSDGGYVIAGKSDSYGWGGSDFWIMRLSSTGNSLWNRTFGGTNSEVGESVAVTSDGGFVLGGRTLSFGAVDWDMWLVRTGPDPALGADGFAPLSREFSLHPVYPNPFNNTANISFDLPRDVTGRLVVYDALGRQTATLFEGSFAAGNHQMQWTADRLSTGTYFVRLETHSFSATQRAVLLK